MSVNAATKYQDRVSNLLKVGRKSKGFTNQDWDWDGAESIKVYTLTDPTIGNYDPTAPSNRYGNATEVQDTVQTWTLSRDRAWTKTIDKKNYQDTLMIRKPGAYLAQATKNVLIPEIDTFVFQTIATAGNVATRDTIVAAAATTSANAYSNLLTLNARVTDDEAPENNRQVAVIASYYNLLKQGGFVLDSDKGQAKLESGDLGTVDDLNIVIVPSGRMPSATDLIISHPSVCVAPEKLVDYTLHDNPPGVSGQLLEYRHRYDAIVDTNKTSCIAIHKTS